MNRTCKIIALALVFVVSAKLFAQERFVNPRLGFGFVAGGAQGANSQSDKWVLHYGGFVQYNILGGTLLAQTGVNYNKLMANDYWAKIAYADQRFMFVPYSTPYFNPFIAAGIGVAKPVYRTGTSYLGIVPLSAGVQTKLSPNVLMQVELFYVYSLSDSLDGRPRSMSDLNPLTNGGQDSFYGARVGLILGVPSRKAETSRVRSDREAQDEIGKVRSYSGDNSDAEPLPINESLEWKSNSGTNIFYPYHIDSSANSGSTLGQVITLESVPHWSTLTYEQKATTVKQEASQWKKVSFAFGRVDISLEAQAVLQEVKSEMQHDTSTTVYVVGYSDNLGNETKNKEVSLYRAKIVKKWLVDHGIAESRLYTLGKGSEDPVGDNSNDVERAKNRRVEFWKR